VLTFDPDRLDLRPGIRALDMGCGDGRHTAELVARGVDVVALDHDPGCVATTREKVEQVRGWFEHPGEARVLRGDAYALPFDDDAFDLVVAAEVLEHLHDDEAAMAELLRVLHPAGTLVVTVPRFGPELLCWGLSRAYHEVEGGHVRIYRRSQLRDRLHRAGARIVDRHHAHALHAPYWWLKCAVGVEREEALLPRLYHRMLVWDMLERPWATRTAERLLDPVLGKSIVLYLRPVDAGREAPTREVAGAG
jgi:SAM-dependent methyltransferase